ncbi:hypothetical protein ACROYT_G025749 [Oculina patagonica]
MDELGQNRITQTRKSRDKVKQSTGASTPSATRVFVRITESTTQKFKEICTQAVSLFTLELQATKAIIRIPYRLFHTKN